jgi:hypothetical protein
MSLQICIDASSGNHCFIWMSLSCEGSTRYQTRGGHGRNVDGIGQEKELL